MKAGDRIIVKCTEKKHLTGMRGIIIDAPSKINSRSIIHVKLYGYKENMVTLFAYRLKLMPGILEYKIY